MAVPAPSRLRPDHRVDVPADRGSSRRRLLDHSRALGQTRRTVNLQHCVFTVCARHRARLLHCLHLLRPASPRPDRRPGHPARHRVSHGGQPAIRHQGVLAAPDHFLVDPTASTDSNRSPGAARCIAVVAAVGRPHTPGQKGAFVLLFVYYLSIVNGGQIFMGYQWDFLLLEAGFPRHFPEAVICHECGFSAGCCSG